MYYPLYPYLIVGKVYLFRGKNALVSSIVLLCMCMCVCVLCTVCIIVYVLFVVSLFVSMYQFCMSVFWFDYVFCLLCIIHCVHVV